MACILRIPVLPWIWAQSLLMKEVSSSSSLRIAASSLISRSPLATLQQGNPAAGVMGRHGSSASGRAVSNRWQQVSLSQTAAGTQCWWQMQGERGGMVLDEVLIASTQSRRRAALETLQQGGTKVQYHCRRVGHTWQQASP